jgi:Ni/Fe-hydrogenase subunit HybB-like protein
MLMNAPILLGIIVVVFGLAPILLGSNAVYMFLGLCAGELMAKLIAGDIAQLVNSRVDVNAPVYCIVQIVLLVIVPIILLMMFRKGKKSNKLIMQIVPAVAGVVTAFMLTVTKLPYDLQTKIQESNYYSFIEPYFAITVTVGLIACVLYLWTKRPKAKGEKKSRKKSDD